MPRKIAVAALLLGLALPTWAQTWLLDVRSAEEFAAGHLAGAIHADYRQVDQVVARLGIAKDEPINLYCRSGRRAGLAQATLEAQGYRQVRNLGGMTEAAQRLKANREP